MKYEIRIISEEDTIKSKTYEDLNKAIEIADKMFNDFVNLDFGDEIVVVEENSKDKKYYWANGKLLMPELKVGDKVKVINDGETYSTYYEFILDYGNKTDCLCWSYGESPSSNEGKIYEIIFIGQHPLREKETKMAIIKEAGCPLGQTYIIGIKGIRKI